MAKVKTKKRVFNTIMAVAAVVIVVAGVMLALNFKGTTSSGAPLHRKQAHQLRLLPAKRRATLILCAAVWDMRLKTTQHLKQPTKLKRSLLRVLH